MMLLARVAGMRETPYLSYSIMHAYCTFVKRTSIETTKDANAT